MGLLGSCFHGTEMPVDSSRFFFLNKHPKAFDVSASYGTDGVYFTKCQNQQFAPLYKLAHLIVLTDVCHPAGSICVTLFIRPGEGGLVLCDFAF